MPFTLAHPAAILPLRRYGVLSALVIGSMMPDLLYFIPGVPKSSFGHTGLGVFLFCLPAGWFCFYFFENYLKAPLVALSPDVLQSGLSARAERSRFLPVTFSLATGIATHLLWDEFTHEGTWVTRHWAFLRRPIFFFGSNYRLRGFALLQDLSSILGLLVVLAYLFWALRKDVTQVPDSSPRPKVQRRKLVISALLLGAAAPGLLLALLHPEYWLVNERRQFLELAVTLAMAILMVELAGLGLWWHYAAPSTGEISDRPRV